MADAKKSGWHKMSEHPDRKQSNPAVSVDVLIKNKFGRYFVGGYYYDTDEWEADAPTNAEILTRLSGYSWRYCDFENGN